MTDGPDASPNFLNHRPGRGDGVRRLNRVPLMIAGVMLLLILAAVTYTYQMRLAEIRQRAVETELRPEPATASDMFKDAPAGFIPPKQSQPVQTQPPHQTAEKVEDKPREPDPNALAWERYRQEEERRRQARDAALQQALAAQTSITRGATAQRPLQQASSDASPSMAGGQLTSMHASEMAHLRRLAASGGEGEEKDLNRAAEKQAWLTNREPQPVSGNTLAASREAPLSPYEIKTGTVIPGVMVGGVNSDLPGQLIAQVRENVYDTATGRYILIPQGSKLIGTYDNAITTGQERVLVAWTRIIFPDASSIDLGKMPGTDSAGFAGFHDQVNTHFWKAFGNALMMSVFTAGVQLSQGGQTSSANGMTAQQTVAAGLGQQLGQLGQEMARRDVQIQPTLEIRPGYIFDVMVTKDMILKPWRKHGRQTALSP